MKKAFISFGVIAILLIALLHGINSAPKNIISKQLAIKIPETEKTEYTDSHGGFHGDGLAFGKLTFDSKNRNKMNLQLSKNEDWSALPLPENIFILMYGGEKGGVTYTDCFSEKLGIPEIVDGYYFFWDDLNQSKGDTDLLNRSALNFTLSLYDTKAHILYFMKYDT